MILATNLPPAPAGPDDDADELISLALVRAPALAEDDDEDTLGADEPDDEADNELGASNCLSMDG